MTSHIYGKEALVGADSYRQGQDGALGGVSYWFAAASVARAQPPRSRIAITAPEQARCRDIYHTLTYRAPGGTHGPRPPRAGAAGGSSIARAPARVIVAITVLLIIEPYPVYRRARRSRASRRTPAHVSRA
jgi:hypothetical protein